MFFDVKLKLRATAFCDLLLKKARFDEAHWIGVAVHSPTLCNGEYAASSLREAGTVAAQLGFGDVASWIAAILLDVVEAPVV
jgi:hypothetical protein